MPITNEQRENRRNYLGSSDMAAILGVSKYNNAYDVWLEKTGKVNPNKETEVMEAGTMFEDGIIKWAEKELGPIRTHENGEALSRKAIGFPIVSHPDGEIIKCGNPVEAKTAGLFGPLPEGWGEVGTDQIPDYILVQVHVHMLCTDKEVCYVIAFLGGRGFAMFPIRQEKVITDAICEKSIEFWEQYVKKDIPPPDVLPSFEMAKRIKREPGTVTELDSIIVENWLSTKVNLKLSKEMAENAQAEIFAALGQNEGGTCTQGMITYLEQTTNRIDSKRLKSEQPEIAKEYNKQSKHRVLRLKKPKKKKF